MYAVDNLSDAIDVTREFLTPARPGLWLRLAVIVFFVSSLGFGGTPLSGGDFQMATGGESWEEFESEFEAETGEEIPWDEIVFGLLIIGAILFLLWLGFEFIGAIMQFVFLQSLRSSEVHVRQYFRENLGLGARLFGFRIGLLVLAGLLVLIPAFIVLTGNLSTASVLGLGLYGVLIWLLYSLVMRFTTEFAAPVMLLEERGVLSAWGRFWPTLRSNPAEYVVYLILVWILRLVVAIAAMVILLILGLVLLIPFAILAMILLTVLGDLAILPMAVLALVGFVVFLLLLALVWVPIETYFAYYALLLLGDTESELDLIPEQRAAVRGDGGYPEERSDEPADGDDGWDTDAGWGRTDDRDDAWPDDDRDDAWPDDDRDDTWSDDEEGRITDEDDESVFDWGTTDDDDDDDDAWETDDDDEQDRGDENDEDDRNRGW